ncbi:alpha-ribazole phosphatase [Lachnospiraceae bacterium NK3A20]|nr:alpha-ribazole phosphatase [Lachnospiraceae bacterium NK3A20]
MKIWITRHGQTELNRKMLMQGRSDSPLNETGIAQARAMRKKIGDVHFDAVYSSPLQRARKTATIIGDVDESDIIVDPRIIEVDFGRYEMHLYYLLGPAMTFYWLLPELLPAPKSVEPVASMVARSRSFLQELEQQSYENVLVACHGGIMRALCGYLDDKKNDIMWRPKPHNCEIRVFESIHGQHSYVEDYRL